MKIALGKHRRHAGDEERSWHFNVALGYGQRSNPLVDGDDIDIYWLADLAWYGQRWFFDNGDIGFTIYDDEHFSLNAIGSLNSHACEHQKRKQ